MALKVLRENQVKMERQEGPDRQVKQDSQDLLGQEDFLVLLDFLDLKDTEVIKVWTVQKVKLEQPGQRENLVLLVQWVPTALRDQGECLVREDVWDLKVHLVQEVLMGFPEQLEL